MIDPQILRMQGTLFASLGEEEIAAILALAQSVHYPARKVIFREGEPGDHLLVVLEGRVKVSLTSAEGKEAILSLMGPGEALGEVALLDGESRSATVTAMEDCSCLVIWRRDFLPMLEKYPQLALKLLEAMAHRLRSASDLVGSLSFLHLPARLARILINLGQHYGRVMSEGIQINLKLSQEELGNLAGVSRESVNRQLRAWEEEGVIDVKHGVLTLKKSDVLFRVSLST
ncbi:MAG: Crp/Fnr family transcriptional regulator [Betaproteobacteria bacterium]|nr:Crp/Fnr family transcriptional regulator [Betaproteobacteria bacterium]